MSGDLFANAGVKPEICCLPRAEHLCGWNYGNQSQQLEFPHLLMISLLKTPFIIIYRGFSISTFD
jgi:hypothetical protein